MHRYLFVIALCLAALAVVAATPTTLRVVDLRWIEGQPELETWVSSLEGTINRQGGDTVIFIVTDGDDAAWADALTAAYGLNKEVLTPGALLDACREQLTGQVRYDPAQPWTRNIALSLAATAPGAVIASEGDLGLPTVADLRTGWTDRLPAYTRAADQVSMTADQATLVLAPESGHLLADYIAARRLLAVGLSPFTFDDAALLRRLLVKLPPQGQVVGHSGDKGVETATMRRALQQLCDDRPVPFLPARDAANLSCFARFPLTRPLVQARDDMPPLDAAGTLALIYDFGGGLERGASTLDYAQLELPALLDELADAALPVGVEVPTALYQVAPALYQLLLARARLSPVELIAAPGSDAATARTMDLAGVSLCGVGGEWPTAPEMTAAVGGGWLGVFVQPAPNRGLPEWAAPGVLPDAVPVLLASRVRSVADLRKALDVLKGANQVIYLDPDGVPPATLAALLPEINRSHTLVTPSQLFRGKREFDVLVARAEAVKADGRKFTRGAPTLRVSAPQAPAEITDADAVRVQVAIQGQAPVLAARLIYRAPDGRLGAADLRPEGRIWSAVLPPMLSGGSLVLRARVVETGGLGESISFPTTVKVTGADADQDGASDTLEVYQGSHPGRPDTDGDGLPDGLDDHPTQLDRSLPAYLPPLLPPADSPLLTDLSVSNVEQGARVLPAGAAITYRVQVDSLPLAGVTLRLRTDGAGTVRVAPGDAAPLDALPGGGMTHTDVALPPAALTGGTLTVEVKAGEKPVRLSSLTVIPNPDGPFLHSPELTPAFPPAGIPIRVRVTAYSPLGVKSVTVKYGEKLSALKSLPLKPVDGGGGVLFAGDIPAHFSGALLIYGAEAEDHAGHVAASPYAVTPIGRATAHTVALLGGRDLSGSWDAQSIWDGWGRASREGPAEDTHLFLARPGTYTVWVLAQPRQRGVALRVYKTQLFDRRTEEWLTREVPAGSADGWYRLGTFRMTASERVWVAVTPAGGVGYCAYGAVVLTQNSTFAPPLRHAVLDWYNSITIAGVLPGEEIAGKKTFSLRSTGNIDAVTVVARQLSGLVRTHEEFPVLMQADGTFVLDVRNRLPGDYEIEATGWRVVTEPDKRITRDKLVTASVRVVVPVR